MEQKKTKRVERPWLSDEEIIDKYFAWCKRTGGEPVIPHGDLERTKNYAYLSNCNGEIARFNLNTHRFETDYRRRKN